MIRKIILIILVVAGIGLLGYPWFSQWYAAQGQDALVQNYDNAVADMSPEQIEAEFQRAVAYNQQLAAVAGAAIIDPFEGDPPTAPPEYLEVLNVDGSGMMASLEIPRMGLTLPVYHGVIDEVLERGVGHIPTTAVPVGGDGTHSVLIAHRGLPTKKLFTDLDILREGDQFYLHVLGHDLAYEVDQIRVVLPEDTSDLQPVPGGDYVSLVTCTPYEINSHRLIVRGHRVPYVREEPAFPQNLSAADRRLLLAAAMSFAAVSVVVGVAYTVRKLREKKAAIAQ
jgi:sortase A